MYGTAGLVSLQTIYWAQRYYAFRKIKQKRKCTAKARGRSSTFYRKKVFSQEVSGRSHIMLYQVCYQLNIRIVQYSLLNFMISAVFGPITLLELSYFQSVAGVILSQQGCWSPPSL